MKRIVKVMILVLALCMLVGCGKTNTAQVVGGSERGIFFMVFAIHFLFSQAPLS